MLLLLRCLVFVSEGNEAFKAKNYAEAIAKYSDAIQLDDSNHIYYSNRRFVIKERAISNLAYAHMIL